MGGGASGVVSGMVSGVAGEGRFEGTGGGAGALLLKPISNAERTGGGATTLLVLLLCVVEPFGVGLAGIGGGLSGDTSCTLDFRGGSVGGVGGPIVTVSYIVMTDFMLYESRQPRRSLRL